MLYYNVTNSHVNKPCCCYLLLLFYTRDGLSSVEGKGGVRGDIWMGAGLLSERQIRQPKLISARIFISLSIPMRVQLVKYARWLVTDFPSRTILGPVSFSHELATDFSRFLENSNSKIFWSCRVRFQVRYLLIANSNSTPPPPPQKKR